MPDLKVLDIKEGRLQARPDIEIPLDNAGRFISGPTFISGSAVAVQDTLRGLLTIPNTNFLAPTFGTKISELKNTRAVSNIAGELAQEVQFVLGYLAQFRADDDPEELIAEIVELTTNQQGQTVEVKLTIRTGTGEVATVIT